MPRNIEIKARVPDMPGLKARVAALATEGPFDISQDDTFFVCDSGRLKLRMFSGTNGELIFYQRPDEPGPKASFLLRSTTADPESMRDTLTMAYGAVGRVRKHRLLYLVGRTRVHLDGVEGLGDFMELEVVLNEGEDLSAGIAEANELTERLQIPPSDLVQGAYLDLMGSARNPT